MYYKKLKFVLPFILISFIVSIILCISILPSPKVKRNSNIIFLDVNNNPLYEELHNQEGEYVELEKINKRTIEVFIAIEDKNFYNHLGIDGSRILKAIYENIKNMDITQGASTITQQLSKNLFLNDQQTYIRKIKEIFMSFLIEKNYSKDDILEAYFNTLYFGHGIYGIQNASSFFFNKNCDKLNLAESIMLVGIINAPSIYSPYINYEKSIEKFRVILTYLYEEKIVNYAEYLEAYNYDFVFNFERKVTTSSAKLYYIDAVKKELKRLNIKQDEGLIIKTFFDPFSNSYIDALVNNLTLKDTSNLSIVIMKPFSNNIIASLGGKDFHFSSFNCAIDSNRQIGSTIKPFIYYLGLKKGMTILTELNSSPTRFYIKDYGFYEPKNFNSLYANQDINMIEAIAYSDNIYAVKTGLLVGSIELSNLLKSFDIEYINTPSSFLGSISTSLLKLTSMYNCLASEGKYYKPSYIESIYKNDGTLIYKNNLSFNPILSKNETIILNQALTSTFDKNLQGYTKPSLLNYQTKRKFAAKTGTTNQDNYVIGYNPSFTIGVWVGDINNNELNEPGKAKKIFQDLANNISLSSSWYSKTIIMKEKKIDPNTGLESSNGSSYYFLKKWDK